MLAVVRIRGSPGLRRDAKDTFRLLRLGAINDCALLPETQNFKGMIEKVKDFVTYGEIDKKTLVEMLKKRLKLRSNQKVDEKTLKTVTGFNSYEELADMLHEGNIKLSNFKELQPVFRLTPPSKGFKSIKEHYPKGDLGYRKNEINGLLERMI